MAVAKELKLGSMGLPISTDILESLFGIGKRLGVGQTKDANWIAFRLPTFCGMLTQEDSGELAGRTGENDPLQSPGGQPGDFVQRQCDDQNIARSEKGWLVGDAGGTQWPIAVSNRAYQLAR